MLEVAKEREARFAARWLLADPTTFDGDDSMPPDVLERAREMVCETELEKDRLRDHAVQGGILRAIEATLGRS